MFKNSFIGLVLGMLVLTGCGYKESVIQNSDLAYLEISRNSLEPFTIHINDSKRIVMEGCTAEENCDKNVRYEVPSGTLSIQVFDKANRQVHQEKFYLGSGNIKKVVLP